MTAFSKPKGALFATVLLATASAMPPEVTAETAPAMVQKATLDEVVVTARKRVENAQDVPISMTVVSGRSLAEIGVSNLQTLSPSVPDFNFTQTIAAADQYFIRGFGSGVNAGFEMAVGTVIDGFFYGRSRYGRAAFLDVSQVEVLKGPQGALIGKNTSAGAINITSNKPTRTLEAYLNAGYEFTGDPGYKTAGAISGPLTERLRGRFAFSYDSQDGWVRNFVTGGREPKTDDVSQRTTLDFDATDNVLLRLFYQYGHMRDPGRNDEISKCSSGLRSVLAADGLAGEEDCTFNYTKSSPASGTNVPDQHNTTFNTTGLTATWTREAFTLTSLTGFSEYTGFDGWNSILPLPSNDSNWGEDYHQWSEELRIASKHQRHLDYIAGVFIQDAKQQDDLQTSFLAVKPSFVGARNTDSTQTTHTAAAFAQINLHLTERWNLTLGGRYTYETKAVSQGEFATEAETDIPITLPGGPASVTHNVNLSRSEGNFSPNASLQWKPNQHSMLYANISRGFKGGGYDLQFSGNQAAALSQMEYAGETVTAYEVGEKVTFDEDRAQLNADLFREDFKNLQVSALLSSASQTFVVSNAAAARSQGVEADFRFRPKAGLTLSLSGAYLDAEFTRFPGAQCYDGQTAALGCVGGTQNLAGSPLQFAPRWAGTFNIDHVAHLGNDYSLTTSAQVAYKSQQYLALNNDPNLIQPGYAKINGQIALSNDASFWAIALIGRNLTNKLTSPFGNSYDNIGGIGSYFRFSDPPREFEIEARLRY